MRYIKLSQGKQAIVDEEDFERVNQFKWCFDGRYAVRNSPRNYYKRTRIYMHNFITPHSKETEIDHIN